MPFAPQPLRDAYHELRQRYTEAAPPNGLLLDIRVPFSGRWNADRACAGGFFGPPDQPFFVLNVLCADTTGPDDAELHDTDLVVFESCNDSGFTGNCVRGNFGNANVNSEATLGLFALGDVVDSTFELPYLVSIDLGGDDTYEQGAGGAIVIETESRSKLAGSETQQGSTHALRDPQNTQLAFVPTTHLDLDGNDTYRGEALAQGAGGGLLVDLGGHDTYEGERANQGAIGGILLDDQGNDTYRAGHYSQGSMLPPLPYGRVPLASGGSVPLRPFTAALLTSYGAASMRTQQPALLIDTTGDDTYEARDSSQGYAVMPRLTGQAVPSTAENGEQPWGNG
ncbi:MAG: hypothetical protein ACREI7_13425, partial [Myxococcota bacterium]